MENLTYADLLTILQAMPKARLSDNVTIHDPANDEYYPCAKAWFTDDVADVLDPKSLVLSLPD